jgi:hypothetical protein
LKEIKKEVKPNTKEDDNINKYVVVSALWELFVNLTILGYLYGTYTFFDCFGIQKDQQKIFSKQVVNLKLMLLMFTTWNQHLLRYSTIQLLLIY